MENLSPEAKKLFSSIEELFQKGFLKIDFVTKYNKAVDAIDYYPVIKSGNRILSVSEEFIRMY